MKYYYKILILIAGVITTSGVNGAELFNKISGSVTISDALRGTSKQQDIIKSEDLESDTMAKLLNQDIPKLTELWTFNPIEAINHEVSLSYGGATRSYMIEHYELNRSHWLFETKTRMAATAAGAYAFLTWGIPLAFMVVSPVITTVTLIGVAGGGAYFYYKDSPLFKNVSEQVKNDVADKLDKQGEEFVKKGKKLAQDINSSVNGNLTFGQLVKEKNVKLIPMYIKDYEQGIVRCIYEGSIELSYGQVLNFKIVLRPLYK